MRGKRIDHTQSALSLRGSVELSWKNFAAVRSQVLRALRVHAPHGLSSRQLKRLHDESAAVQLASMLPNLFDSIRVYHASRPLSVTSYYEHGLLPLDRAEALRAAKRIFLSTDCPELSETDIEVAAEVASEGRHGHLYVVLDDQSLIQDSGHYLIYGSEYICGIAAVLMGHGWRDYQALLRQHGVPTVFTCRLPFTMVNDGDISELAVALIDELSADPEFAHRDARAIDFSFHLQAGLPAECVLDHYHPDVIPDPLRGGASYRWR